MKNQYFGDVNDYRKYGLLRAWQSTGEGRLLVAWMLTPNDGGGDGRLRWYLDAPKTWAKYDPDLFAGLADLLRSVPQPSVSLIEGSELIPRTRYYSEMVPDGRRERDAWRTGLLRAASEVDTVFLDPDNGIEVPSRPVGCRGSSKYVTWQEIQELWKAGCSLLIYQHFPRKPRDNFVQDCVSRLATQTGVSLIEAFRTAHVLFLLAAQERHEQRLREVVPLLSNRWNGQIQAMGLVNRVAGGFSPPAPTPPRMLVRTWRFTEITGP